MGRVQTIGITCSMPARGAHLSVIDMRMARRHDVACTIAAEHLGRACELVLNLRNISANGVLIEPSPGLVRGDRLILRLPALGQIEAYCIWTIDTRAGCQFERILHPEEFGAVLARMKPEALAG
ncbi:PilZ domain-containing protein [Croceibacterium sp. TMG7-5b_MA50]|uniref:PilZ domain-containing protein n=1 Tax=Croceibacterium sp. TMG7-5b_MA50 TaxID=3121290 RepID=UPI0032220E35